MAEAAATLRQDSYDLELLISFGTSKGGSAGHLALAIRDGVPGDDLVYSANFYADRSEEHAKGFYNADLMVRIPKLEYLFRTASTVSPDASFGLDYGEIYKRSVVGVRVYGVPAAEKEALAAYFARINEDYRRRAKDTEYHDGEVKYGYMHLNCAKTIGSAFKYGAGYRSLAVKSPLFLPNRPIAAIARSNIPTEMALKLMKEWDARGYGMDVVLYKKASSSPYVDPHDEGKVPFKDLPNRFPSVLSLDFRNDAGDYEDYDNLFAMYLLYNLGKSSVRLDEATGQLEIQSPKQPLPYSRAASLAKEHAEEDSKRFLRRLVFKPQGRRIGD
ncbi:MAG TPA: hypothetical protein VFV24_06935 [Candidatus Eisenbacteria bacterium]|nr:hypothetical protein [Candidatus Eisenbacteria bacterium]